ncbi:MAG: hypothetical protein MJD61_10130, partial [Proteobacteria bacterium]|nr:hypothetical protein [Pseudomonadota bacterium]
VEEFLFYHLLITFVDRLSRLPRNSTPPDIMRLYRENLALKAQNGALLLELNTMKGKRAKMPMRVRAAQVFAYLLTRGNPDVRRRVGAARRAIPRTGARGMRSLRPSASLMWPSVSQLGHQSPERTDDVRNRGEAISLGERKAIQREQHLCGHCSHAPVCKVAAALEPHLLVIISQCMAFDPDGGSRGARS